MGAEMSAGVGISNGVMEVEGLTASMRVVADARLLEKVGAWEIVIILSILITGFG